MRMIEILAWPTSRHCFITVRTTKWVALFRPPKLPASASATALASKVLLRRAGRRCCSLRGRSVDRFETGLVPTTWYSVELIKNIPTVVETDARDCALPTRKCKHVVRQWMMKLPGSLEREQHVP